MTENQTIERLRKIGFTMGGYGVKCWGQIDPEPFNFGKNHILSKPFRDVFIGKCRDGWYVTSHIKFKARDYRRRYEYTAELLNIFGGGSTLEVAMMKFESNFHTKTYNQKA